MVYNLSLINGSGVVPLVTTVSNELMFGWYGNMALITLFVIFIMGFISYTNNFKKSVGISSLLTAVFSVMFHSLGFVPEVTVLVCWVIAAVVAGVTFLVPD